MRPAHCLVFSAALALVACAPVSSRSADSFATSGEMIALSGAGAGAANACIACHGLRGEGDGAFAPRLAGLDAGYLESQLIAYADGRRHDPQMSYIAGKLDAPERRAVAAYYALLNPPPPARTADSGPAAARLYRFGDASRGLPSCASCHGERGEGAGSANPPLAAQPAGYLAEQLERWRRSSRRNDPGDVMLRISHRLSPSEGAALARHAAALPGGPPSPEPRAAFRAAHRDGPRNDASGPPLHVPESARAAE